MFSLIPRLFLVVLIRIYQWTIAPLLGRCCRFYPSCSEYALAVLKKHGFFKAIVLSTKRICKCNPWNKEGGGYDPPP